MNGRGLLMMGEIFKANGVQQGKFKNGHLINGKCKIESEVSRIVLRKLQDGLHKKF